MAVLIRSVSPGTDPQTMFKATRVIFREATTSDDLRQICALNHRTFAEELGQHPVDQSGLLVDRFHDCNRYFIAVQETEVVGMISAHTGPDFSVAGKLANPQQVLERFANPIEVRLLAIARHARNGTVLAGLFWMVYEHALLNGHSHLLISGITDRERMYRKLGFEPLGSAVQAGAAMFIPMAMKVGGDSATTAMRAASFKRHWLRNRERRDAPVLLLPGPVEVHPEVEASFKGELISHRCERFVLMFEETRAHLSALAGGLDVAVFPGSGTLANDLVAANLKAMFGDAAGVVVSNGEFGERLANQAGKAGLVFHHLRFDWGEAWDRSELDDAFEGGPAWVWAVHLETSTGVLNDVDTLVSLAASHGAMVALDCVSSLGAVEMPPAGDALHFMTAVSGKAIGSYAGLGIVYVSAYAKEVLKERTLCPSFDLARMAEAHGPCTTIPSPLLLALREALRQNYVSPQQRLARYRSYQSLGRFVRRELIASGLSPLCREAIAAPTITTFCLPDEDFPTDCLRAGYRIAYESPYLRARRWGQIATMGNVQRYDLDGLAILLREWAGSAVAELV